ncbi:hypothetical protein CR513_55071, partial [Mucuna pruriens]
GLGLVGPRPTTLTFRGAKRKNIFRKDPSISTLSLWCVSFCSFHTLSFFFSLSLSLSLRCFRSQSVTLTHPLSLLVSSLIHSRHGRKRPYRHARSLNDPNAAPHCPFCRRFSHFFRFRSWEASESTRNSSRSRT